MMDQTLLWMRCTVSKTGDYYQELKELNNWDDADKHYEDEQVEKHYKKKKRERDNDKSKQNKSD